MEYWRDSLIDGQRAEISPSDFASMSQEIPFEQIAKGRIDPTLVRSLWSKENSQGRGGKQGEEDPLDALNLRGEISVLICPLRFVKKKRNTSGPQHLTLLWMPAVITGDGSLFPARNPLPWIPRIHLEPILDENAVTISNVEKVDKFFDHYPPSKFQAWGEYWQYAAGFLKKVTGAAIHNFELEEYERRENGVALIDAALHSNQRFIRIFSEVLAGERSPGLIPCFASVHDPYQKSFSTSKNTMHGSANLHCGQFDAQYPLARSQRNAVHRFFETPNFDFLSVTGPPGTGKTTLLQSIVASLFVQSARVGAESPPITVVCGATNQSVMNVIDSFGRAKRRGGILNERWLPKVESFGTFCCSEKKAKEIKGYQVELRDGNGFSLQMENWGYVRPAEIYYLECFEKAFNRKTSLSGAIKHLRSLLNKELGDLYRETMQRKDGQFLEWLQGVFGMRPKISGESFFRSLEDFDTTIRHRAFLLASHYWEGRWIFAAQEELNRRQLANRDDMRLRRRPEDWRRRAMVTPAFVSTLSMMPTFFDSKAEGGMPFIDVLIFDEAGQIPPEVGVALSALGRKALVVGDYLQLEPVWNVPQHIDVANLVSNNLAQSTEDPIYKKMARRGLLASQSSFMQLAIRSSRLLDGNTYGVALTEHRRSVPELVHFSNTLAYGKRLEPLRPHLEQRVIPPFGYVQVSGTCRRVGSSRMNRQEVATIAEWLKENRERLCESYQTNEFDDLVAVVSPFAAQIRELKRVLADKYPKMTIGTVHSLQGAERPIVIFSSVYDASFEGLYFFDRGVNMLNVAVSRAKDSFIVVGDMGIFDESGDRPSSLLARYLFADEANELSCEVHIRREDMPRAETKRLSTLLEHQQMLEEAFEKAEREVFIVSPTISSAALQHDRIPERIAEAVRRGVKVTVYTDRDLDFRDGAVREKAAEGRKLLQQAGAELIIAHGVHNKSLVIDHHTLVEGSFNWFSAVRTVGSRHQKHESSFCLRGPDVPREIERLRSDMEFRAGKGPAVNPDRNELD